MPTLPDDKPNDGQVRLNRAQLRILLSLARSGGYLSRQTICDCIGISPTGGTFTSAVNGVREGSSHGKARPSLEAMGLLIRCEADVEGTVEVCYAITDRGRRELLDRGVTADSLPPPRARELATNKRYRKGAQATC